MSEQTVSKNEGSNTLDEAQVEGIAGGGCTAANLESITASLKQSYENLVDFTSHVIQRVANK
jgi:hypothetical protein